MTIGWRQVAATGGDNNLTPNDDKKTPEDRVLEGLLSGRYWA
jgi:hypothetical protein